MELAPRNTIPFPREENITSKVIFDSPSMETEQKGAGTARLAVPASGILDFDAKAVN
jgi:hypothetical protein